MAVTYDYGSHKVQATSSNTTTFTDMDFGVEEANRVILIGLACEDNRTMTVSSVGGLTPTLIGRQLLDFASGNDCGYALYYILLPTGTSGDIVVTSDGNATISCHTISVYGSTGAACGAWSIQVTDDDRWWQPKAWYGDGICIIGCMHGVDNEAPVPATNVSVIADTDAGSFRHFMVATPAERGRYLNASNDDYTGDTASFVVQGNGSSYGVCIGTFFIAPGQSGMQVIETYAEGSGSTTFSTPSVLTGGTDGTRRIAVIITNDNTQTTGMTVGSSTATALIASGDDTIYLVDDPSLVPVTATFNFTRPGTSFTSHLVWIGVFYGCEEEPHDYNIVANSSSNITMSDFSVPEGGFALIAWQNNGDAGGAQTVAVTGFNKHDESFYGSNWRYITGASETPGDPVTYFVDGPTANQSIIAISFAPQAALNLSFNQSIIIG